MTVIRQWTVPWESDPAQQVQHAEVLVFLGHAEYSWGTVKGLKETYYTFDLEELAEPTDERFKKSEDMRSLPEGVWKPFEEEYSGWGTFVMVEGTLFDHHRAFEGWAASMMCSLDPSGHKPGGDDDYFDYWPSGMEGLRTYAIDLDEVYKAYGFGDFYTDPGFLGVYDNVLLDFLVREYMNDPDRLLWEHIPDYIEELAQDYKMTKAECADYIVGIAKARTRTSVPR
jgi:hypothetical protein